VGGRVQKAPGSEFGNAHYVSGAAEIQAWLLFPDALTTFSSSWKPPPEHRGKDADRRSEAGDDERGEQGRAPLPGV
jgi:hypothetical protein